MKRTLCTPIIAGVSLFPVVVAPASAGEKPARVKDIPKPVQTTMHEQSKGAKIVGTQAEDEAGTRPESRTIPAPFISPSGVQPILPR